MYPLVTRRSFGPMPLTELHKVLKDKENLQMEPRVLPLAALKADEQMNVITPEGDRLAMTGWCRSQICSTLGLKSLERWFENCDPEERAFLLNRRLTHASGSVKLKTTKSMVGVNPYAHADGVLEAVVSPSFADIQDSLICELLMFQGYKDVIQASITDRTVSFTVKATEHGNPENRVVGEIWGGITFQNSSLGYCSFSSAIQLWRLVCSNGMSSNLANSELFRRKHAGDIEQCVIEGFSSSLEGIQSKLQESVSALNASVDKKVANVRAAIEGILKSAKLSKRYADSFMGAYEKEPVDSTVFSVVNAVTDAATIKELDWEPEQTRLVQDSAAQWMAQAMV